MKIKISLLALSIIISTKIFSQAYPAFGNEIPVTISGLTFDAMEPFISADGNSLFFNSINNGTTTSLYFASKVSDSVFTYAGPLSGANETVTPHLNAVPSSDSANNFYWVSQRNFPAQFDNFFRGSFNGSNVVNIGRIHGTFYIYNMGWIIMDAAINYDGTLLYYCNAYFGANYSGCGAIPCQAKLGVAQKENDSTFNKLSNSDALMQNVNDTNYIVYAPIISRNGLELYYTRIFKSNPTYSEICLSVRTSLSGTFSLPSIIYSSPFIPESPTLTTDQSKMYYHKKAGNLFKIFLRYRDSTTSIEKKSNSNGIKVFPNPSGNIINIELPYPDQKYCIEIFSAIGQKVLKTSERNVISIENFASGIYILKVRQGDKTWTTKLMKR